MIAPSARWPGTSIWPRPPCAAWVQQAEIDQGERPGLTTEEREELTRLRRENRSLREDVEILKRATAFFAKETR